MGPRFNNTSASNKIIYAITNCLITTKLVNCIGIVLLAPEAQPHGGGLSVIAHLDRVYRFIVLSIRNGISTAYAFSHHSCPPRLLRRSAKNPCHSTHSVNGGTTANIA